MVRRVTRLACENSVIELLEPRLYLATVPGVWSELGFHGASGSAGGTTPTDRYYPDMAIDANGYPIVVWQEGNTNSGPFTVARHDGSNWNMLGGQAALPQGHDAVIALDRHTGTPYVAWVSGNGTAPAATDDVFVSYWNGTAWVSLGGGGGASNDGVMSEEVSLAIGEDSRPVVAYKAYDQSTNDFDIVVKRWDGNAWVELTSGRAFGRNTGGLATYYGGGVSDDVFDSFQPSIAIGPDNAPIVAWGSRGFAQDSEIYVRRWNGTTWEKMGANSASDPSQDPVVGISNTAYESVSPRVLVAPDPTNPSDIKILVGWSDYQDWLGKKDVVFYMRRWDSVNHTWVEVSAGSATGNGILGATKNLQEWDWAIGADAMPLFTYAENSKGYVVQAIDSGGVITWTSLGAEVNPNVPQISAPCVEQALDGTIIIAYTSSPASSTSVPWDAYTPPSGAGNALYSQVLVQFFHAANNDWDAYGRGSDQLGGIENSIGEPGMTYNSPPQLGTDAQGNPIMVYLHRVEESSDHTQGHLVPRILKYDEVTNTWAPYGIGPMDIFDEADYNAVTTPPTPMREGLSWYGDMLLIASDPRGVSNMDGMPVIAFLDSLNANTGGATIKVYGLDDMGTTDPSDDTWKALNNGYAYSAAAGKTIDQVELVGWQDHKVALFWRESNPAGAATNVNGFTYDGSSFNPSGESSGDSKILSLLWTPTNPAAPFVGAWAGYGQAGPRDLSTELSTAGLDFAPSAIVDSGGRLILSFASGKMVQINTGFKTTLAPVTDIQIWVMQNQILTATYAYDSILGSWVWSQLDQPVGSTTAGTLTYHTAMNPSVAIGYQAGPMPAWSDETLTATMTTNPISKLPAGNTTQDGETYDVLVPVQWKVTAGQIAESTYIPGTGFGGTVTVSNASGGHIAVMPSASGNGSQLPVISWTDADPGTSGYWVNVLFQFTANWTTTANPTFAGWSLLASYTDIDLGLKTSIVTPVTRPWSSFDKRDYYQNTTQYYDTQGNLAKAWLDGGTVPTITRVTLGSTGFAPGSESIHVKRWDVNANMWDQYDDTSTNTLSASGTGISGVWGAGVMGDLVVHTVGSGSSMASQPVVVWCNAYEGSIYGREFKHEGMLPKLLVIEGSGTANDDILDFGPLYYTDIGQQTMTFANHGTVDLVIYSLGLDAPGEFEFYDVLGRPLNVSGANPLRIAPNSSIAIVVKSVSTEIGSFSRYLTVNSNDPTYPYGYALELKGSRHNNAQIWVEEKAGIWGDNVIPFNIVRYGEIATRSFWIHNLGTDQLAISQFSVGGLDRNFIPWTRAADYVLGQTGLAGIDGVGGADVSQQAAQSFKVAGDQRLYKVMLYLGKIGNPTDNFYARIETSVAGKPSGTAILNGVSRSFRAADVDPNRTGLPNFYNLVFDTQPLLTGGTTYWIVLYRDGAQDASNRIEWGYDDQGGYANGQFAVRNAGGWDAVDYAGVDGLFVVGSTLSNAVIPGGDTLSVNVDFQNSTSFDNIPITVGTLQQGGAGNEIQTVTIDPTRVAAAGTFTLTFSGQTTAAIPYHASTAELQVALEALSTIGAGNVLVGGLPGAWTVTFRGALANTNVSDLSASSSIKEIRDVTAYAVIRHDDNSPHGIPATTAANPIIVTFTANKPDFESVYTVSTNGVDPSIGPKAVTWTQPSGIWAQKLNYPLPAAGQTLNPSGISGMRSKTDGDYIVWEESNAIWMHQISQGVTVNLTGSIAGNERSVNIDNGRIVFASDVNGNWDIYMMTLPDFASSPQVQAGQPVQIPEPVAGALDFFPDIDGDMIVWRTVLNPTSSDPGAVQGENNNTNKGIYAYHIPVSGPNSIPFQVTSGVTANIKGPQIPVVSDGRIVWVETIGTTWQLHYSDTETSTAGVILDKGYPISDIPSLDASMVSWAAQPNYPQAGANWDLYAYYFPLRPGEVEGGPAIRGRIFQLTYDTSISRINPSTYGRLMAFQESTSPTGPWQVKYGTIPGVPNILITENSAIANDKVLEYGTIYRGIPKTLQVTLSNNGTDDAVISKLDYNDLHVFVKLPDGSLLPDNYRLAFGQSVVLSIVVDPNVAPAIDPASGPQQCVLTMTTDDWDNPVKTLTLNYTVAWPAELVANAPTTTGALVTGRTIHVSAVVNNTGLGNAAAFTGQFYLDGVPLSGLINIGPMVAGASVTVGADVVIPLQADGSHSLSFTADVANVISEVLETNNTAQTTLIIDPSWDPAAILPLTVPAVISNGAIFTITGTIKNLGDRTAPAFSFVYYLSATPTPDVVNDPVLARGTISGLAPNQVVTDTQQIPALTRAQLPPDGVYYVVLVIDPTRLLPQFDRNNDSRAVVTHITRVENAPTLTRILPLTGAIEDTPFTITYDMLTGAADESDLEINDVISFRITSVDSGTLTKGGIAVTPGVTTLGQNESLIWTPVLNANGIIGAFHVVAVDDMLQASLTPVLASVDVTPVNDIPTLTVITPFAGTKGVTMTITYDDLRTAGDEADVESPTLSFRIMQVLNGTLTRLDGTAITPGVTTIGPGAGDLPAVKWTSSASAAGTVNAFSVAAFDGTDVSTPPVAVRVVVNNAPTMDTVRMLTGAVEDTDFSITYAMLSANANEYDADGDVLTFIINAVSSGTLTKGGAAVVPGTTTLAPGETVIWRPAANANGVLNAFTVSVTDGKATSASPAQVSVNVAALNDNPGITGVNTIGGATEDQAFDITFATLLAAAQVSDVDNDPISFVIDSVTANGTLTIGGTPVDPGVTSFSPGQTMTWTPAANLNGVLDAFAIRASDGQLLSGGPSVMVKIDVMPVNDAPAGANQTVGVSEGANVDITLGGTDLETLYGSLVFNVPARAAHGTLTMLAQGQYRYLPDAGFNGEDTFTYTVTDSGDPAPTPGNVATSTAATVTIHVGQQQYFDSRFPAKYLDSDGDMVTVTLSGPGSGWVYFPSAGLVDATGIVIDGSPSTKLNISVKSPTRGKAPSTTLRYIEAHGGVRSITGTTTDMVGGAAGGHITVTAPSSGAINAYTLTLRSVQDVGMQSELPITTLTAGQWTETAGGIEAMSAPWIKTLKIRGNPAMGIAGDFGADLTLTGAGSKGLAVSTMSVAGRVLDVDLAANAGGIGTVTTKAWGDGSVRGAWIKTLKVAGDFNADVTTTGVGAPAYALSSAVIGGNMTGSVWAITGDVNLVKASGYAQNVTFRADDRVNSISLGASRSSDFFAGVNPGVARHAGASGDFTNGAAFLKSFKVLGTVPGTGFQDSNVSASAIGTLSVLNGDFTAGGVWSKGAPLSSNVPGGFVHIL